jgi:ABC-2 type transport system permease protein
MMNAIRAEWIKLRTIRSTWVLLFVSIGLTLLISLPISIFAIKADTEFDRGSQSMITVLLFGVALSTSLLGVVSTLLASGEFRFTIRQTFAAEPKRMRVFAAKVITSVGATAVVGAAMIALALGSSALILKIRDVPISFANQGWSVAIGSWLYLILFSLAGMAIAFIIRHSAGAIVALLVWSLLLEGIVFLMATAWFKWFARYLPFSAGQRMSAFRDDTNLFGRWNGGLYFAGFVAVLLAFGAFLMNRRDA